MTIDLDAEEQARFDATVDWLKDNSPDDWHRAALDFNWGEPLYLIDWIVRQPECDIATALTVFWLGEPECWLDEEGSNEEESNGFSWLNRKICEYVAQRVAAGGYTRSQIAFEPDACGKTRYVQLDAAAKAFSKPNIRAFPDLIRKRRGRTVDTDEAFYRRYPREFHHSVRIELPDDTPRAIAARNLIDKLDAKARSKLPSWLLRI